MLAAVGVAAAVLPIAIGMLRAQTLPPAPAYGYDVVSIHKADPKEMNTRIGPGPQGGIRTENVSVMQLLTFAYDVRPHQIVGAPGWVNSERYDVSFTPDKPEPGIIPGTASFRKVQATFSRHRQRMQAVLRDRFGLILHTETREMPMYALVIAKGGHKLSAPADPGKGPSLQVTRGMMTGVGIYMELLTNGLAGLLNRHVKNETGLDGPYDFTMKWTPDSGAAVTDEPTSADSDAGTSVFTSLTEQLGLKLEAKKGPVPVFVVEKVERPSEN
jgi:uncharacterized protein (TIGR03435 family)